MPQPRLVSEARLLAHFFDVLVRRGVEGGLAGGVGEGDLPDVADGDGRVGFFLAKRALTGDGADNVGEVGLGGGGELGFALVAAKRNGLAVLTGSGDAWIARFAADWAFVSSHGC